MQDRLIMLHQSRCDRTDKKSAARELASRGITVNALHPGFIDTEMTEVLSEEGERKACKPDSLGKFGKPEDIANAAAFLASDEAVILQDRCISRWRNGDV